LSVESYLAFGAKRQHLYSAEHLSRHVCKRPEATDLDKIQEANLNAWSLNLILQAETRTVLTRLTKSLIFTARRTKIQQQTMGVFGSRP